MRVARYETLPGGRSCTRALRDPCTPDGERILNWTQVYGLTELPPRLIVVGSGVTGAEFASAYDALGCDVTVINGELTGLFPHNPEPLNVNFTGTERNGVWSESFGPWPVGYRIERA